MELKDFTVFAQGIAAVAATLVGGYTIGDKLGLFEQEILTWSPEHFSIKATTVNNPITVTVARIKKREDCSVEKFTPLIKDTNNMVHTAIPSIPVFSGPASKHIDTFTYELKIDKSEHIKPGPAVLLATIKYKCPEGERTIQYPEHKNLTFMFQAK